MSQRGLGWCWHLWTKWSEVRQQQIKTRLGDGVDHYQQRDCEKCGRTQQREVNY